MIHLRWTAAAAEDLQNITDYLFDKTPENGARLVRRIYDVPSELKTFPNRGRPGKKQGTRELLVPSLPYIVVYRLSHDVLYIVRILHAAQAWPL